MERRGFRAATLFEGQLALEVGLVVVQTEAQNVPTDRFPAFGAARVEWSGKPTKGSSPSAARNARACLNGHWCLSMIVTSSLLNELTRSLTPGTRPGYDLTGAFFSAQLFCLEAINKTVKRVAGTLLLAAVSFFALLLF